MIGRRSTDELFDFKRIFRLMLGLVVLPTLFLSGFGILAIKNERAALEKRLQDTYDEKATQLERVLIERMQARPAHEDVLSFASGQLRVAVGSLFPGETAQFALVPKSLQEIQDPSIMQHLRTLSPNLPLDIDQELGTASRPIVRHTLPDPLQHLKLDVYLPGSDPIGDAMLRNTIVYSSLMVVFLAMVIVGVIITARFIHREVRLSRLQTDFVSNISHELRTPLTSIRMFIETLQMGRVSSEIETRECLEIMAAESERLTRMIERILGWARMEAGRRIYTFRPIPTQELVQQAVKAFRTQRFQAAFTLKENIEPDLPPIRADMEAISEALLNILNNALKYTGENKLIGLRAYHARGMVAIEVTDNGIGISLHDRKRIFDKFYRADALLSRKTEGSGLGLSIVRHIVEAHSGKVQVESELGWGSRFIILLPTASRFGLEKEVS